MFRQSVKFLSLAGILCLLQAPARAGGHLMNVQGKLSDSSGAPLSGAYTVTFRLYSVPSGGTPLWSESQSILISAGLFNVTLGASASMDGLAFNTPYYLGFQVAGDAHELSPRQKLAAAPYALGSLGSFAAPEIIVSTLTAVSSATISNGNVGNLSVTNLSVTGNYSGPPLGRLKQVVYAKEIAGGATTSGSFVPMGASATITPTSANSKILILGEALCGAQTSTDSNVAVLGLGRNGTPLFSPQSSPARIIVGGLDSVYATNLVVYFQDAPGMTTPVTYQLMLAATGGANTAIMGGAAATGNETRIVLMEYE